MTMEHIPGQKNGHIMLYALSTCVWCQKTKDLLDDLNVEYYYTDVDLLKGEEREEITKELMKWNPKCSFPTLVINDNKCIVGFKENEIKETIGV